MSLPPGFLDELRTRVTLSSVVGRKVTWDMRKSNMAKGDFWAPCPFHQEKSASFHVDDRKGFYYCFGCHAKGDAVTFVKESENLGFMEAVEVLAREAGMQMPARDPRATEKADHRTLLGQVVEEALKFYRLQLKTSAGAEARRYLTDKRRLPEAAWERWELGWSPESGQAHRHDAEDCPNLEEVVALLAYTLQHNIHHDAELRQMQEQLRLLGLGDAAEQLGQSMADFAAGNARLAILLKTLQE